MKREPKQYKTDALIISRSASSKNEKNRYYLELLAHMRSQYRFSLNEEEVHKVYRMIQSLIVYRHSIKLLPASNWRFV